MKGSCCCLATGGSCSVALVSSHLSHTSSLHQSMSMFSSSLPLPPFFHTHALAQWATVAHRLLKRLFFLQSLAKSPIQLCFCQGERITDMESLCWFSRYHNEPKVGAAGRFFWYSFIPSNVKKRKGNDRDSDEGCFYQCHPKRSLSQDVHLRSKTFRRSSRGMEQTAGVLRHACES